MSTERLIVEPESGFTPKHRVLHVLDHSLPVQSGYAYRSAAILREQAAAAIVIALTGPKQGPSVAEEEIVHGQRYYRTRYRSEALAGLPVVGHLEVVRSMRKRIRTAIALERPEVIHAHSPCLNGLAALGLGKPLVYEWRSSWEDAAVSNGTISERSARYRLSRELETYVLRRADFVVTICEGMRASAIERGVPADRVTVVPNAVDAAMANTPLPAAGPSRKALGVENCFVLGFIGSFFAWEGLDLLIRTLPRLLRERPDTRVLLVGDGQEMPRLRRDVAGLGLDGKVIFTGQVPHAEVPAMYAAIDLLVFPRLPMYLTELVTPLKPLEAMAVGKPLVASDVGGHRELVRPDETGLLFTAGDGDALVGAILRVMGNADLARQLGENGRRFIRDERLWSSVVQRYDPVYSTVSTNSA